MRAPSFLSPCLLLAFVAGCASTSEPAPTTSSALPPADVDDGPRARVLEEARAVRPLVDTAVHPFLDAAAALPSPSPRFIACTDKRAGPCWLAHPGEAGAEEFGAEYFFTTRYGSPISYARPLTVLAAQGFAPVKGQKILDFGYGYLGHLWMLAELGALVHGVEVDPLLPVLYEGYTGPRPSGGSVTLHHGALFVDEELTDQVGGGYDLILSKNVLKRGYIHPEREAPPQQLIDLGVDDATFVQGVFDKLAPGGLFLLYNLCPKQNPPELPYIPWADGRSPFAEETFRAAGFEVVAFDVVDDEAIRALAHALGWDSDMKLDELFAHYTLARRPTR